MLVWFLSLKKNTKVLLVFVVIGVLLISYFGIKAGYYKYKWLKEEAAKVEALQHQKEGLIQTVELYKIEYEVLEQKKQRIIYKTVEIENKLKENQDEKNNVPGAVALYTNTELDSAIRNHKHIKRAKN
jgi:hypothetical protein